PATAERYGDSELSWGDVGPVSDSRFSSTPSSGGGDPYGFFAQQGGQPAGGAAVPGPVPGQAPAAPFGTPPSPFGTPPSSGPPFGTPAASTSFGSPAPYAYATTPQTGSAR